MDTPSFSLITEIISYYSISNLQDLEILSEIYKFLFEEVFKSLPVIYNDNNRDRDLSKKKVDLLEDISTIKKKYKIPFISGI